MKYRAILKTKCGCERTIEVGKIYPSIEVALITADSIRVFMLSRKLDATTAIYEELLDKHNSYEEVKPRQLFFSESCINPYSDKK
jgi:hypothetical protein